MKTDVQTVRADMEIDGKTHEVQVGAVQGVEDGDLILSTERDGETVKLGDVDLEAYKGGDEAAEGYEKLRRYMTGGEGFTVRMSTDAANLLLSIMRDQPDGVNVMDDGYKAYAAGVTGVGLRTLMSTYSRLERAVMEHSISDEDTRTYHASASVMLAMWEAGVRERKVTPGAVRIGAGDVTQKQVDEMFVVGEVFKDYGRGVVFVDELYSSKKAEFADLAGALREGRVLVPLSAYNAYTGKTENNTLLLSADHETVHQIKVENRTLYDGLRDMAIEKLKKQLGEDGYKELYAQRAEAYRDETWMLREDEIRDYVEEEITAQYFGAMQQRAFCEEEVKKNPGLWEKVKEVFRRIVEAIKKKLEQLAKKDLVVKAVLEADLRDVQEAYSILDSVLRYLKEQGTETENKKTAEEAVKMSKFVNDFSNSFSEQIANNKKVPKSNAIYSSDEMERIMDSYGLTTIWDYRYVQNRVFDTLVEEGFFGKDGTRTTIKNSISGMLVEIDKKSIEEAFYSKNFLKYSTAIKIGKLITIRHIKDVIENGILTDDNVPNQHKKNTSLKYAYIEHVFSLDGKNIKLLQK